MRKLAPRLWAIAVAPFLASCVFLLDYDDLQGGPVPNDGGTTAAGGMPGTSGGAAGDAGNPPSCGDCNDQDAEARWLPELFGRRHANPRSVARVCHALRRRVT